MNVRLIGPFVVATALMAAGCGERLIDVGQSEKLIRSAVVKQVGADVASVVCPDKVKVKAQAAFTCVVTGRDGTKGTATVTQTNGKGAIRVSAPFLSKDLTQQSIQTDLRRRSPRATVVCPDIIVVKARRTFECQADLGPVDAIVTATQTDADGNFTYTVK